MFKLQIVALSYNRKYIILFCLKYITIRKGMLSQQQH